MLEKIYPRYQQRLFTNREYELDLLEGLAHEPARPRHVAIVGLRKIGKTWLIKEFLRKNRGQKFAYINVEEIVSSPEIFSIRCIGKVCYWLFGGEEMDYIDYAAIARKNLEIKSKALERGLRQYDAIVNAKEIDYAASLNVLFSFVEDISNEQGIRTIVILDEFQDILTLNKYRNIDMLKLYRKYVENAVNVSYFLSGSAIHLMKNILGEASPLFELFKEIHPANFTRISTRKLVRKILPGFPAAHCDLIYRLSNGHPFYISNVCEDLNAGANDGDVKTAFIRQVLSKGKAVYSHCHYVYKLSLKTARGYNNLKAVLQILSQTAGLRVGELSQRLRKPVPAVEDAVEELVKVDLLKVDEEKRIFFVDPVLRFWISYFELGIEIEDFSAKQTLLELINDLDRKYQAASTELGKAKEYELRVKLEARLGTRLANYSKGPEFDLMSEGGKIIIEIKWTNRPTGAQTVRDFVHKAKTSEFLDKARQLILISKSGFTDAAGKLAKEHNVELMSESDFN